MQEYKSNSNKLREAKNSEEVKKVEKIVSGNVRTVKKSGARKFAELFIPEDVSDIKSFIIMDILVPAAKKVMSDTVDMILYGGSRGGNKGGGGIANRVSYQRYYDRGGRDSRESSRSSRSRATYDYDDILLPNRVQADAVLDKMDALIAEYGLVSICDYYDLVGVESDYTSNKYGWTDLRTARVERVRDGYIIRLPKAVPLD